MRRPMGAPRPQSAAKKTKFFLVEKPILRGQDQLLKDLITNEKYAEQRETFKRLAKVDKGGTDMSEPVTYYRAKKMSQNKKVNANTHKEAEHARELQSLKSRMEKIGSWQHRKKNGTDPLANPVWFFKGKGRDPNLEKKLDLSYFERKLKEKYIHEQA